MKYMVEQVGDDIDVICALSDGQELRIVTFYGKQGAGFEYNRERNMVEKFCDRLNQTLGETFAKLSVN